MSSGVVPKYTEQREREAKFVGFTRLIQSTVLRDATDHISRAWVIILFDKVIERLRHGCSIDDVFDAIARAKPSDTRVMNVDIHDEKTPLARPSALRRST